MSLKTQIHPPKPLLVSRSGMGLAASARSIVACSLLALIAELVASEHRVFPGETVELDPYTVVSTGTRSDRLRNEVPIRTEIIGPNLFLSAGTRDLAAALEYMPGIRSEANCQNCGTAEIKMLGLGSGYNRLLFDGQPLFSGLAAVYGIEHVPTAFIDRIEVVKGGASSLYGPGAVAGVINILPRQPVTDRQRYDLSFESIDGQPAWSHSLLRDWASDDGETAFTLYGQFNDSEAVDLNGDGFSEITEKQLRTVGANGWLYPTENGKLSVNYSYTWEERRGGNALQLAPHESQITEQLEHNWHRGGVAWESRNEAGLFYRLSGSVSYIDRDSYYGGVGAVALPGDEDHEPDAYAAAIEDARLLYGRSDTTRYFIDTFFSKSVGTHHLAWGAQYQIDEVFDEKRDEQGRSLRSDATLADFRGQDPIAEGDFENLGFFVQDEWIPTNSLSVIGGLRLDKHSELEDWILSPRLAARYSASDAWTWRASVATGFRAPELFDEDFHIEILNDPTRTRNAAGLREERATSYAVGLVWTPVSETGRLQLDGQLFRTELRDTFSISDIVHFDSDGNAFKDRVNAGDSAVQGVELNASFRLSSRLSAETGVSFVDARYGQAQEALPDVFERRYLETPKWTGVAQLKYENDDLVDLFLGVVYTGPMIAAKELEGVLNPSTDSFFVVDLTATKHLHWDVGGRELHIDLMAGVKNLFDARQRDIGSGPDRDATYFYGPRFPRSFVTRAGVSW